MCDSAEQVGGQGQRIVHRVPLPHRSDGVATALRDAFAESQAIPADIAAMLSKLDADVTPVTRRR
jgi:hypothetical protein